MAGTAFLMHPASPLHDTGWTHPEHQGRLRALASSVGRDLVALHGLVEQVEAGEATEEDLELVHTPAHIAMVKAAAARAGERGEVIALDPDTRLSGASWDAALGSVGASLRAASLVAEGRYRSAFVATRPPGHHATPDRAMGFCLFNNLAVTARWLQRRGLAERILAVDWDVHHGNGTQDAFWSDPSVFYFSMHLAGHWPGTGSRAEAGEGEGEGFTLNEPVAHGTGGAAYRALFERSLDDILSVFDPDFVLVSSGFDALAGDPLGGLALEPSDFHALTTALTERAEAACGGRVVALLEGGYDPARTGLAAVAVLRGLAGVAEADPLVSPTLGHER